MIIHKDCYSTIIKVWLGGALGLFLILKFIPWPVLSYLLCIIPLFIMGFVMFFFRVPQRSRIEGENVVTSVADGRVVVIEKVYEPEHNNQSSAASEMVQEAATMIIAPMSTKEL